MRYIILLLLLPACATYEVVQRPEQPKMIQCKILCQGGDAYSYQNETLHCNCKKPVDTKIVNNYYGLPDAGEGVIYVNSQGRYIVSKVKK